MNWYTRQRILNTVVPIVFVGLIAVGIATLYFLLSKAYAYDVTQYRAKEICLEIDSPDFDSCVNKEYFRITRNRE